MSSLPSISPFSRVDPSRGPNLSFFNFLLISYLPRNRDHRIKRMSRRSASVHGRNAVPHFSLYRHHRTLPRPFDPECIPSSIPPFFVLSLPFRTVYRDRDAIGAQKKDILPRVISDCPSSCSKTHQKVICNYVISECVPHTGANVIIRSYVRTIVLI